MVKNGVRKAPDVSALASLDGKRLAVMVWHYHDDDLTGPDAAVSLKIPALPVKSETANLTHYRIDETHSNAFTLWKSMGEPQGPSASQYQELEAVGKLATLGSGEKITISNNSLSVDFNLPRQGVSLLIFDFK
jgi:xylan 1,4-beta-xylosidase